jgi:hypothetical protein
MQAWTIASAPTTGSPLPPLLSDMREAVFAASAAPTSANDIL